LMLKATRAPFHGDIVFATTKPAAEPGMGT
jgi:hypothetical protein